MKFQTIFVFILAIVCAVALFVSAYVWKDNIRKAGMINESTASEIMMNGKIIHSIDVDTVETLSASLDEATRAVLLSRLENSENVQMLIIGSEAIRPVAGRFASVLMEKYEGFIDVDIAPFDMTSTEFVAELDSGMIDWATGYDIVLFEPFTLNNNGKVIIEDERADILAVKAHAARFVDNVSFLITPPQPVYKAQFYLTQVSALEQFTADQGIPYIDHWENWPDHQTEDILPFLDDKGVPTDLGVEAWVDGLVDYFVAGN